MADVPTVPFVMHGARAAIAVGMQHIEEQVKGIEEAVEKNPSLAFDLAKTLIESACRTILNERSIGFDPGDDLPKLFRTVTNSLPFLPVAASDESEVRKSLAQTLGGLHSAVQGVCELRNACGFASHGAEGPRPVLETVQALLAAETADAIIGFLHRVHRQDRTPSLIQGLKYDDNPEFNEYVDQMHKQVRIFDEDFAPSRILFELAPEPYRLYVAEYEPEPEADGQAAENAAQAEAAP